MDTTNSNILKMIESSTESLLGENLRSKTKVISRIYHLIMKAQDLGYTHEAIHSSMKKAGFDMLLRSYLTSVHRVKKGIEDGRIKLNPEVAMQASNMIAAMSERTSNTLNKIDAVEVINTNVTAEDENNLNDESNSSSATQASETLKKSVNVGKKDYSKLALQQLKNQGKLK